MTPAAAASLVQLFGLISRTVEREAAGELTDEQAKAIYDAAADRVTQAYENFRNAAPSGV